MSDIVTCIIEKMQEKVPAVTEEMAGNIERVIRRDWGGCMVFIAKTCVIKKTKKNKK
jgi:hypothetical protein